MSWNVYRKILNILFQNLMLMEYFEIYIIKLSKKLISLKLVDEFNPIFVCSLFYDVEYRYTVDKS